jgi:predicted O-methyltransferase YrrM
VEWPVVGRTVRILATVIAAIALVAGCILAVLFNTVAWLNTGLMIAVGIAVAVFSRSGYNAARLLRESSEPKSPPAQNAAEPIRYAPGEPLDYLHRDLQRDITALLTLQRLLDWNRPVPAPGGWAATPETLLTLVDRILCAERVGTVVELGSGASTVWIAMALKQRGEGSLISVEHDPAFAWSASEEIERRGLGDVVQIRLAPLVEQEIDGVTCPWYDRGKIGEIADVTLLFVDGPPGSLASQSRAPAYPAFQPVLADGAWVILDDIDRPDEREIVEMWTHRSLGGGRLKEVRSTDRAAVLEFGMES